MSLQWIKYVKYISISLLIIIIGYVIITLLVYRSIVIPFTWVEKDNLFKKAIRISDLRDKDYIVCKWARVSGSNFKIVFDENGKRSDLYCLVT